MRLGTGVLGVRPASIVWTHSAANNSNAALYTFNNVSFGAEAPSRRLFVAVVFFSTVAGFDQVTIGGVPATPLIANTGIHLFVANVPTGTTGTVVVDLSAGVFGAAILVWAGYDLRSATPLDTATAVLAIGTATADLSVDTRSGGIVVAAAGRGANGTDETWTGVVEDSENTSAINNVCRSAASALVTAGETPRAITLTSSNTTAVRYAFAASFR